MRRYGHWFREARIDVSQSRMLTSHRAYPVMPWNGDSSLLYLGLVFDSEALALARQPLRIVAGAHQTGNHIFLLAIPINRKNSANHADMMADSFSNA